MMLNPAIKKPMLHPVHATMILALHSGNAAVIDRRASAVVSQTLERRKAYARQVMGDLLVEEYMFPGRNAPKKAEVDAWIAAIEGKLASGESTRLLKEITRSANKAVSDVFRGKRTSNPALGKPFSLSGPEAFAIFDAVQYRDREAVDSSIRQKLFEAGYLSSDQRTDALYGHLESLRSSLQSIIQFDMDSVRLEIVRQISEIICSVVPRKAA